MVTLLLNSACALTDHTVVTVKAIELVERQRLGEFIPAIRLGRASRSYGQDGMIKVDIEVEYELLKNIDHGTGKIISVDVYFCDEPKTLSQVGGPSIYSKGEDLFAISAPGSELSAEQISPGGKPGSLYFFLTPKRKKDIEVPSGDFARTNQKFYAQYDLENEPIDVCFTLRHSNQMITWRETKPVTIGKSAILAAFGGSSARTPVD